MKQLVWALGALGLLGVATAPQNANALVLIETVANLTANGITNLDGNQNATADEDPDDDLTSDAGYGPELASQLKAATANSNLVFDGGPLFPNGVDFIGKIDLDDHEGISDGDPLPGTETDFQIMNIDLGITFAGAISLTCIEVKDEGEVDSECIGFHWVFDQSLVPDGDLISDWNIVKIGVKTGEGQAFFLIDPFAPDRPGADSGDFFGSEFAILGGGGRGAGLSNISFFGSPGTPDDTPPPPPGLPEPLTLALVGLGLVGLAAMRRRVAA